MSLSFYQSQSDVSVISFRDTLQLANNFLDNIIETVEDMQYTYSVKSKLKFILEGRLKNSFFLDKIELLSCFQILRNFKCNKQNIKSLKKLPHVNAYDREADNFLVSCIHQAGLKYAVVKQIELDRVAKIIMIQSFYRGRLVRLVSRLLLINHRIEQENKQLMRKYRNHNSVRVKNGKQNK